MKTTGKILLMDDDTVFTKIMSGMLSNHGFSVHTAHEGGRVVELYEKSMASFSPYDVVILDLYVAEGMSGEDTLQRLHVVDPNVRAIISSGLRNDAVMKDCRAYGFVGALAKPYDVTDMVDAIRGVMAAVPVR